MAPVAMMNLTVFERMPLIGPTAGVRDCRNTSVPAALTCVAGSVQRRKIR
jgi:hypothetical protein